MPAQMLIATPGCGCKCGGCPVARDPFNRDDEQFQYPPINHNWIAYRGTNSHKWEIKSNLLQIITGDGSDYTDVAIGAGNTYTMVRYGAGELSQVDLSEQVKISLPAGGKMQLRLRLGSTQSFSPCGRFAVEIEAGAADGDCWTMRLFTFDRDDYTGQTQIGDVHDVPLEGFSPDTFYPLRLCVDPQNNTLRACLTNGSLEQWHHADDIVIDCQNEHFPEFNGCVDVVGDIGWAVDSSISGTYKFHDFALDETKAKQGYYGDYSCYGYGNRCPCCAPRDCETVTFAFPDGDDGLDDVDEGGETDLDAIDCRLATTGTVVQEDGYLKISEGGRVDCLSSSSGISSQCLPDDTTRVAIRYRSSDDGASVKLYVGDRWAQITLESSPGADDGSLTLSTGETSPVAGLTVDTDLDAALCFDGLLLFASVLAGTVEGDGTVGTGVQPAVESVSGEIDLVSLSVSHNLLSEDCPTCGLPSSGCDVCATGRLPVFLVIRISGITGSGFGACGDVNGTWLLVNNIGGIGNCCWHTGALAPTIGVCFQNVSFGDPDMQWIVTFFPGGDAVTFKSPPITPDESGHVDCEAIFQLPLTLDSCTNTGIGGGPCVCDYSSAGVALSPP